MIVYLVKFRPFKLELQQVVVVSDEFVVIGGVALLYTLYHNQYDPEAAYQISVAIVGVILLSFMKNICIIIFLALRKNYIKIRSWVHKKYNVAELKKKRLQKELEEYNEKLRKMRDENNGDVTTGNENTTGQTLQPQESQVENQSIPDTSLGVNHSNKTINNQYHINITSPRQIDEKYCYFSNLSSNPESVSSMSDRSSARSNTSQVSNSSQNKRAIIEQMRNFQKAPSRFKMSSKRSNPLAYPYRPKLNEHKQGQVNGDHYQRKAFRDNSWRTAFPTTT